MTEREFEHYERSLDRRVQLIAALFVLLSGIVAELAKLVSQAL